MADEAPRSIQINWTQIFIFAITTVAGFIYSQSGTESELKHMKETQTEFRAEIKEQLSDLKLDVKRSTETQYRIEGISKNLDVLEAMARANQERIQNLEQRIAPPKSVYVEKGR